MLILDRVDRLGALAAYTQAVASILGDRRTAHAHFAARCKNIFKSTLIASLELRVKEARRRHPRNYANFGPGGPFMTDYLGKRTQ